MNRISSGLPVAVALGALLAGTVQAGNPELGRTKAAPCAACHGVDGLGTAPEFPVLAGQYEDYLVHSLTQYRDGQRQNAVMSPFAAELSDRDIRDLAAFYASLRGLRVPRS